MLLPLYNNRKTFRKEALRANRVTKLESKSSSGKRKLSQSQVIPIICNSQNLLPDSLQTARSLELKSSKNQVWQME